MGKHTKEVLHIAGLTLESTNKGGSRKRIRPIVQHLNLCLHEGEMLGLVGESGSGKSMTAAAVLGLLPRSVRIASGDIVLNGNHVRELSQREQRKLRGKTVASLFQNYQGSFTPFFTIGSQLVESLRYHDRLNADSAKRTALSWLERVQLPAERVYRSYPFQLSGGQLQRAAMAAALMLKPKLVIADEPTTALDVLTGEHVLDLLAELRKESGCAVLLISHDLSHVLKRTDRIAVMYGGQLAEVGMTDCVRSHPQHPYTQLLLAAKPSVRGDIPQELPTIPGEPGAIAAIGCAFASRCPHKLEICDHIPETTYIGEPHRHTAACHLLIQGKEEHHHGSTAASGEQRVQEISAV